MDSASQLAAEAILDFSCNIGIRNNTDEDLLLSDFGIEDDLGDWPVTQPWNTVERHSSGRVVLNNTSPLSGTRGWVQYEIKVGGRLESLRIQFADPSGRFKRNSLECQSSNPNRLQVDIKGFNERGRPLDAEIEISSNPDALETNPQTFVSSSHAPSDKTASDIRGNQEMNAKYQIGFDWPGPGQKYPVHESVAIAAFLRSAIVFPKAVTYNNLNPKQWEYFRGIIWNDDPSCLLFKSSRTDNRAFGIGIDFYEEYLNGDDSHMTQRSHFGDLQFLHAMGGKIGEQPQETCDRLLKWIGIMYKLACGNQEVDASDQLDQHFPELFDQSTDPMGVETLRDLFLATRPEYQDSRIPFRALGSCLHIIQDSYAMGHVQRRLRNPQDLVGRDDKGHLVFKPGTWAQWGAIIRFHTYSGQDHKRHDFYDGLEGEGLPDPRNLDSFNRLNGTRDAIAASTSLINAVAEKRPWETVRETLKQTTFAIDREAKECNTDVDGDIVTEGLLPTLQYAQDGDDEVEWQKGLLRKLSSLEAGFSTPPPHQPARQISFRQKGLLLLLIMSIVLLAGFCISALSTPILQHLSK